MASKPSLAQAGPRLLILGGGPVVTEFYLPALSRLGWTSGITVTDRSPDVLAKTARLAPWAATRALGFQEALADRALTGTHDAVVVAVPNSLHVAAVEAALQAGLPVLCEKPLALQAAECQRLGELAASLKLPLAVGMVRRLSQAARAVRRALEQGLIGELKEVRVEHGGPYAWTSMSGAFFKRENGGILADLGVHHLDWLGSVLGDLSPVSYEDDARGGVEASCSYALTTPSGVPVSLRLTHLHPLSNTTTFVGDEGELILGRGDFATCQWRNAEGLLCGELRSERVFDDASWPPDFLSCFAQQFANFACVVRGEQAECVSAREASVTMRLIEHAYAVRDESSDASGSPALPSGRVVVTGGTGFIGTALVERLVALGFTDIVVPVRGYQTCASVARFPVRLPRMDLNDREAVRELVKGARWVFHLAFGKTAEDARSVTVDGTRILVEEAESAGVEAVVVLGTTWVYGSDSGPDGINEDSPFQSQGGHYGDTKAEMQRWCLQRARSMTSTRLVVINPSCVYGPEGRTYARLPSELMETGNFAWVNGGAGIANLVYIGNLLDAVIHVATHNEAHGRSFIACDCSCTWREFLEPLLGGPSSSVRSYTVDELKRMEFAAGISLREVARSLTQVPALRGWVRERWLVQKLRRYVPKHWKMRPAAAAPVRRREAVPATWLREIFGPTTARYSSERLKSSGWRPRVSLAEGQRLTVEWLRGTFANFPKT